MRQDRKLNKFILCSAIMSIILAVALLVCGGGVAVYGYLKPEKLLEFKEVFFFVEQEGFIKLQTTLLNGGVLKTEFLFLFLGIFIAVVGLIALIFAILNLNYAKKFKVVRRRFAILVFNLIPLAIAGSALTYVLLEFDNLLDNIKYVAYVLTGGFGFVALLAILGVLFSRSEQFMSNDNNKFAFDNSSLRNARAEVNNNVRDAQPQQMQRPVQQPMAQNRQPQNVANQPNRTQPNQIIRNLNTTGANRPQQARPQGQQMRAPMPRPQGQTMARPNAPAQPVRRPINAQGQSQQRPMQPRPMVKPVQSTTARPVSSAQARPNPTLQRKFCTNCGNVLAPGQTTCAKCGYKTK